MKKEFKPDPEALNKFLARFDVTLKEYEADKRWKWAIKKCVEDDSFFLELKAEREQDKAEISRLKRKINGLLDRLTGEPQHEL